MKSMKLLSEYEFSLFQRLLVEKSGLFFDEDRKDGLSMAISERLEKFEYGNFEEYYHFLQGDPEGMQEFKNLLNLVTIGETYFFRNKPQMDALIKFVLPEIIKRKENDLYKKIRVWSAGCSRGDEPYSIAMAIMEILPDYKEWEISILGTDINQESLKIAYAAAYSGRDIEYISPVYLKKYFDKTKNGYVVKSEVKRVVDFKYHNMAKDFFNEKKMSELDIVFCRNVTIYFDFEIIKDVVNKFYDCFGENGFLFMGHAETLWQITDKFKAIEFPKTFVYKKDTHVGKTEASKPFMAIPDIKLEDFSDTGISKISDIIQKKVSFAEDSVPVENLAEEKIQEKKEKSQLQERERDSLYRQAMSLFNNKNFEDSIKIFNQIIEIDAGETRAYFLKANILANQAKYNEAIEELSKIIEVDNLYVEAYYLLGVLMYKTGDFAGAEKQFRRVAYIDPKIVLSYFNLGNVYLCQKKNDKAAREFINVIRLLEDMDKAASIRLCEEFTVEFLLRACQERLAVM